MPDYTPILHSPVPLKLEADDVPAALMAALADNEKASVPTVDTITERDARFNGADITLVSVREPPSLWAKTGDSSWHKIWSDTGWKRVTLADPWSNVSSANPLSYRVIGSVCYWRGVIRPERLAADTWTKVCTVPDEALPPANQYFPASSGSDSNFVQRISSGEYQYQSTEGATTVWLPCLPPYVVAGA